jgi:hypothetical protein
MTDVMIGATTTTVMIGTTITMTAATIIVIGIGRTTLGGGRPASNQLITPSTPSSQCPSVIMRMSILRSFRVLA